MHIFLNPDQNGRNGMTLEEFRFNKFNREIVLSSRNVTAVKCQEWENHAMSYVTRCLREEDTFLS